MQIKFKKLVESATIPSYSKVGDAGLDLIAISKEVKHANGGYYYEYDTGLSIEIPIGYVGLIFPRSSQSNVNLLLTNHCGVIDSGYRGSIRFRFKQIISGFGSQLLGEYEIGDRIGQLIILPYPTVEPIEVDELSNSERGEGGFGSTGK